MVALSGKEDYDEDRTSLGTTFEQVKELKDHGITVDGIHYTVIR